MTIQEVLKNPDSEILRVGVFVRIVVKEWMKITGGQPSACDCQLKNYLRVVRNHYDNNNDDMSDKFYYNGCYYNKKATEEEKAFLASQNIEVFKNFALKYGWNIDNFIKIEQNNIK